MGWYPGQGEGWEDVSWRIAVVVILGALGVFIVVMVILGTLGVFPLRTRLRSGGQTKRRQRNRGGRRRLTSSWPCCSERHDEHRRNFPIRNTLY